MATAKAQPAALERLLPKLRAAIATPTSQLADNSIDVDAWRAAMEQQLTTFHGAAYLAGARQTTFDELARKRVAGTVSTQLTFLNRFAVEIEDAATFEAGWQARAEMYAESIKEPFWAGRTKVLPLPALPGDGTTQCLTHCKCLWSIDELDAEAGDYDCYWIRNAQDSCQTCIERASQWSPLRIRGGVLQ